MFTKLKEYKKILVCGPQRSGTAICTAMIANDTGHEFIAAAVIHNEKVGLLDNLMNSDRSMAIQCTALTHMIEKYGDRDDTMIVFVRRRTKDIIASQERIQWSYEPHELKKYGSPPGPIATVKLNHWRKNQRGIIKNNMEVEYEKLKDHPMWIEKKDRADFKASQIEDKGNFANAVPNSGNNKIK